MLAEVYSANDMAYSLVWSYEEADKHTTDKQRIQLNSQGTSLRRRRELV